MNAKRACVYYPNISPPTAWIKQSLLYWDTVCSVVHADFHDVISTDMALLLEEGLYEPLFSEGIHSREEQRRLRDELFLCIDNAERLGVDLSLESAEAVDFLYYGKLALRLQEELIDRGLVQEQNGVLVLSSDLFSLVMCLLAKYIAAAESAGTAHYSLHTDSAASAARTFLPLDGSETATAAQLVLRDVLPVPDDSVAVADVVRFRKKHSSRLAALRRALDGLISELAKEEVDVPIATRAKDELAQEVAAIGADLRAARLKTCLLSVSVLVLPAAVWAAPAGSAIATIAPWLLGGFGTTAAIEVTRRDVRRSGLKRDFSYLHKAVKRFT